MNDFNRKWAAGLRALIVLKLEQNGPQTTRELATACQVSEKAIAPRMTELEALGEARDSGRRKSSVSGRGRKLKVWAAVERTGDGIPADSKAPRMQGGVCIPSDTPSFAESSEPVMRLLA